MTSIAQSAAPLPKIFCARPRHALRHFFASTALHEGETIRAVSEYLGHADPGFTLRTYTHLMEGSSERTKRAIDTAFLGEDESDDDESGEE